MTGISLDVFLHHTINYSHAGSIFHQLLAGILTRPYDDKQLWVYYWLSEEKNLIPPKRNTKHDRISFDVFFADSIFHQPENLRERKEKATLLEIAGKVAVSPHRKKGWFFLTAFRLRYNTKSISQILDSRRCVNIPNLRDWENRWVWHRICECNTS
jgi:hypothetical protein